MEEGQSFHRVGLLQYIYIYVQWTFFAKKSFICLTFLPGYDSEKGFITCKNVPEDEIMHFTQKLKRSHINSLIYLYPGIYQYLLFLKRFICLVEVNNNTVNYTQTIKMFMLVKFSSPTR